MKPRILVPFDFSAAADSALAWAADLHKSTGAAPIQIVHAISARAMGTAAVAVQPLLPNEDEIAGLEARMVAAASALGAQATAKVLVKVSEVGDIILDTARTTGAELIVMGTHGRTGVRRLLLGSVAEHVLRHADCPVVTVQAPHGR
jgi:nucleotide-binding universal stress UspA family protein